MSYFEPPQPDYSKYSSTRLLLIPLVLLLLSILVLSGWYIVTGVPVDRGIVFTGGSEVRLDVDNAVDSPESEIRDLIGNKQDSITSIAGTNGYIVKFAEGETTPEEIESNINENDDITITSLSQVSPSLGQDAQITAITGVLVAFLLMSILVIILFRSVIPAVVIILSAVSNIFIATATMNIVGIELSMGAVGALLMLIGYSVDSDILMNSYVIKQKQQDFNSQVHEAMRTGITMTISSLSAMIVMFIVASIFGIGLLADMGFILAVGLTADLINTYMMNVAILRWYVNRGDKR